MLVSTIISQARSGELNQLSTKSKTDEAILDYIDLALIALNNRFQLDSEEAIVTLQPAKSVYKLDGTDVDVSMPDTTILNLTAAYEEDGTSIPINDSENPYSVLLISYNKVQIPIVGDSPTSVALIYTRNIDLIDRTQLTIASGVIASGDYDIKIPISLLEPILHYIGYRANGSMDANIQSESNTHLMRFKASCDEIQKLGVIPVSTDNGYLSIEKRGWV